jgi:integrase
MIADSRRTLKLVPEARAILQARIAKAPQSGWLFEGKAKGTHLSDVENGHQKILKSTGLAFVLYDLRHTAATRWAERGMDIATLAKILGHANLRTVQRYVHIGEEHAHAAMLKYGQAAAMDNMGVAASSVQ